MDTTTPETAPAAEPDPTPPAFVQPAAPAGTARPLHSPVITTIGEQDEETGFDDEPATGPGTRTRPRVVTTAVA